MPGPPSTVKRFLTLALACLAGYFLFWPVPFDPARWVPPPIEEPAATPTSFATASPWGVLGLGPEDIARGHDGAWYTGLDDGRIVSLIQDGTRRVVGTTGGRPLGIRQLPDGALVVADAFRGLLRVEQDGAVRVLADSVNGHRLTYPDALDLAPDGTIWMSDASARHPHPSGAVLDFWDARPTGRLLQYDPAIGRTTVALDSLDFANGVAVGPDGAYVLVNETLSSRITRLWITGPRAGSRDVFIEHLPGLPDNLSYDGAGMFWVALYGERTQAINRVRALAPLLRRILYRVPERLRLRGVEKIGWVLGIDTSGTIRYNLVDRSGATGPVTSVIADHESLYLGSLLDSTIRRVRKP
ncbi:MAG TPA: SMP-30/gluconolactonase/LRE family protein [Gemmatimonadales bacterium]|nr:SMP-30/gluconolactonase/LRE family protein [Gemmatimonadales bacterium]